MTLWCESSAPLGSPVVPDVYTHVATSACINGNVTVGSECLIGSGTVILQGINICDNVVIGAGSLVRESISEPGVYAGNPLGKIK